jgi:hypothetical protein
VAVGDFNGDGLPDLAVANAGSDTVSVLLDTTPPGATTPSFAPQQTFPTGFGGVAVAVGDFDGDGKPDLAVTSSSPGTVSVLLNTTAAGATTPSFAPPQTFATDANPISVAVGDFNGDGKPDLAVANANSDTVSVLLNDVVAVTASGSPATGTISSVNQAPADIEVVAGTTPQSAVVTTAFAVPLAVDVRDAGGFLVQGVTVIFAVPGSGPSGTFDGSAVVLTDATGRATAPTLTANTVAGSYTAVAVTYQGSQPTFDSFRLTNTAAAAVAFAIAVPDSVPSGVPFSITVSAVDPYGNVDTNYVTDPSGVVHFFTTTDLDPGVMLPDDYPFTAADRGVHTFDGVVYVTPGDQDLNAFDTAGGLFGSATVTVTAGPAPGPAAPPAWWLSGTALPTGGPTPSRGLAPPAREAPGRPVRPAAEADAVWLGARARAATAPPAHVTDRALSAGAARLLTDPLGGPWPPRGDLG